MPVLAQSRRCGVAPALACVEPTWRSEQIAVRFVGKLCDRNAQTILKFLRNFPHYGFVPAADEHRCNRAYLRIESSGDPALDSLQVRFRCADIVLG